VEWLCIKKIMLQMGFHIDFVQLIMICISTTSFSFKINGEVSGYVIPSRGIRQGDPLSPYLFLVVAEILSALVNHATQTGHITGLKISPNGPAFSHLLFADDSLFFCKATVDQALSILSVLDKYHLFTGQCVNWSKSSIFFSRKTPVILQNRICAT
ncbi:Uncharacterized mitochondrial protein AtMg01250, partial [Striga hermonthica]